MERESTLNPGMWQSNAVPKGTGFVYESGSGPAYGLVQWDGTGNNNEPLHYTKHTIWCREHGYSDYSTMDANLDHIIYEINAPTLDNGYDFRQYYTTSNYPETFEQFTKSTKSLDYLTRAFLANYERAGVEVVDERITNAKFWFDYLKLPTFTARLNDPADAIPPVERIAKDTKLDKFYGRGNAFYKIYNSDRDDGTYGLPNCTAYAWGRFWEIMSDAKGDTDNITVGPPNLSLDSPSFWLDYNSKLDNPYKTGNTPALGAIAVWSGHVAIVEHIEYNNDNTINYIITSDSGYSSNSRQNILSKWPKDFWWVTQRTNADGNWRSSYTFLGFIYNPVIFGHSGGGSSDTGQETYITSINVQDITDTSVKISGTCTVGKTSSLTCMLGSDEKYQNSLSIGTENFSFTISDLVPNKKHTLTVTLGSSTKTVSFKTRQSYPSPATNIKLKAVDKKWPSKKFQLTFTLPVKRDWGYWGDQSCLYKLYFIINGQIQEGSSTESYSPLSTTSDKTLYFYPNKFFKGQKFSVKTGDSIQVGIQTCIKVNNELISHDDMIFGSNALCLREETYKLYLKR